MYANHAKFYRKIDLQKERYTKMEARMLFSQFDFRSISLHYKNKREKVGTYL